MFANILLKFYLKFFYKNQSLFAKEQMNTTL